MFEHIPVLFEEVKHAFLEGKNRKHVIDATLGLGGHARMLYENMEEGGYFFGIERDEINLRDAEKNMELILKREIQVSFIHESFSSLGEILVKEGKKEIDFILYDLGVSSAHYDDGNRGFSLRNNAPLDMRFDRTTGKTAEDLVMTLSSRELMHIFTEYADEKKAYFIAEEIAKRRKIEKITTTFELRKIVEDASFDKKSPIRVFQALRIATNEEFEHIKKSIEAIKDLMSIGGRIAVITFHSLEDGLVKSIFSTLCSGVIDERTGREIIPPKYKKVNKKPIEPTILEQSTNQRSRSAKLRIIQRIN